MVSREPFSVARFAGWNRGGLALTRPQGRRYRIWFRPNHVLGVLVTDKTDVGPVRDKAREAVAKLKPMMGG